MLRDSFVLSILEMETKGTEIIQVFACKMNEILESIVSAFAQAIAERKAPMEILRRMFSP